MRTFVISLVFVKWGESTKDTKIQHFQCNIATDFDSDIKGKITEMAVKECHTLNNLKGFGSPDVLINEVLK